MRLVLFYLVLLVSQGFLSTLLAPLPAPNLFLLAVLTLLWRVQPWQLVLLAYAVGLMQDVIGQGVLGLHALSLAAAALTASMVRAQLTNSGVLERMLVVFLAVLGKWAVMAGMLAWISGSGIYLRQVGAVAAVEGALTVAAGLLVLPWSSALLERSRVLQKELL